MKRIMGVFRDSDNTFAALTYSASKTFKTRKGAENWLTRRLIKLGYSDSDIWTIITASREGDPTDCYFEVPTKRTETYYSETLKKQVTIPENEQL